MTQESNQSDSGDSPDVDEMTSIEMLADYECPECGPVEDVDLTEDEATAVFAGDENGNLICANDWCDEELGLTAEAALANMKWLVERLPHLAPRFVDEIEGAVDDLG